MLNLITRRVNCFEKKAIAHPKKSQSTIITPSVDYEQPICCFLIVKKRYDECSDSASKTITFAFKTTNKFFKERSLLSDTKKHICTFFVTVERASSLSFLRVILRSFHCYLGTR